MDAGRLGGHDAATVTEAGDALVEETAGSSTPKHSSEAMAFSTFKEEAAAPQESDAGKAAPTGSGEKPSWTPDVMLENGLPWTVDQAGNKIFGTFMDAPSKDGMAMVRFPGVALPVEVASLLFDEIHPNPTIRTVVRLI